ncbi:glycosyltransferase [Gordonia westfalica]|uniref:Glycosyltransferase n=1 Tax=Gordonia westfalica TaxID=158898 RepID=A0ABU2GYH1_9ACTN|nr:glycosyltransferase [Gordonia westfalica]MDS1115999.1 glycosyltransferase [Gordonia westfalica]
MAKDISGEVLWTFSPVTYGLEHTHDRTVYHSVDFLHTIPGVPTDFVIACENDLLTTSDAVAVSSSEIRRELSARTDNSIRVWENVGDVGLFRQNMQDAREPKAVFCGNLTPTKVDFSLLMAIADRGIDLVVAGPTTIDGESADTEVRQLLAHTNVHYAGTLSQEELSILCGSVSVGLIPYELNSYTRGVFPMKVYEYIGAGLPVVATKLPSLEGRVIAGLDVCEATNFVDKVERLINEDLSSDIRAELSQQVSRNSWESRTDQVERLIEDLLAKESTRSG